MLFNTIYSLLRLPPVLIVDEVLRQNFRFKFGFQSDDDDTLLEFSKKAYASVTPSFDVLNGALSTENKNVSEVAGIKTPESMEFAHISYFSQFCLMTQNNSIFPFQENMEMNRHLVDARFFSFNLNFVPSTLSSIFSSYELTTYAEILFSLTALLVAFVVFVMPTHKLAKFYSFVISLMCLKYVYQMEPFEIRNSFICISEKNVNNFVLRAFMASVFHVTRISPESMRELKSQSVFQHLINAISLSLFFLTAVFKFDVVMFTIVNVILQYSFVITIPSKLSSAKNAWVDAKRLQDERGFSHMIQVESNRLRLASVFRLFWLTRALFDGVFAYYVLHLGFSKGLRHILLQGTCTFTGILGLTPLISSLAFQFGEIIYKFLYWNAPYGNDLNRLGDIVSFFFIFICFRTGLTSLGPQNRLQQLVKNLILAAVGLCNALYLMVCPLLQAFRSFQGIQIRAVLLSVVFFTLSLFTTIYLTYTVGLSTWLLVTVALAVEFKIKMVILLLTACVVYYSQLPDYPSYFGLLRSMLRYILPRRIFSAYERLYDNLSAEDLVFFLSCTISIVEFLTGIVLFLNGVWMFFFESCYGTMRAICMCIHAYYNIWCEAKKGWKVYCLRRSANAKIEALADATPDQLQLRKDDVCAICYEEMESAKVTKCGHLFHAVCVRKWFYVQSKCPLCHEVQYEAERSNEDEDEDMDDDEYEDEDIDDEEYVGELGRPPLEPQTNFMMSFNDESISRLHGFGYRDLDSSDNDAN